MSEWIIKSALGIIDPILPICQIKLPDRLMVLLEEDAITKIIRQTNDYEPHFTNIANEFIRKNDNVIDCGANCGFHTITMSKLVGNNGKVFSFEPLRVIHQQLNCNIFINGLSNVISYNCSVGHMNILVSITPPNYFKGGNIGNTWIHNNNTGDSVGMIKLDDTISEKINFIKLDIQGCELLALNGAINLIKNHKPILFVEMEDCHLTRYNTNSKQLSEYIKSELDYDVYKIITDYPCDYLCVPKNTNLSDKKIKFELQKI